MKPSRRGRHLRDARVPASPRGPVHYAITVDGVLPADRLAEFTDLTARYRPGVTVLAGALPDQATLVGTMARIEDLGGRVSEFHVTGRRLPVGVEVSPVGT